jgi:hypothetical protein
MDNDVFLGIKERPFLVVRYQNLWYTTHKVHHMDSNATFYIYKETIRDIIERTPHILLQVVEEYKEVVHFKEGHHHMYVQN